MSCLCNYRIPIAKTSSLAAKGAGGGGEGVSGVPTGARAVVSTLPVATNKSRSQYKNKSIYMLLRSKEGKQLLFAEWVLKTNFLLVTIKTRKVI